MTQTELFDLPDRPTPTTGPAGPPDRPDDRSTGQRRRDRQRLAIGIGQHPLSVALHVSIPLHPAARRDDDRVTPGTPRCGGCALRRHVGGAHDGVYPKCTAAAVPRRRTAADGRVFTWHDYPRLSNGAGTDVAAWWPACTDYQPAKDTP